MSSVNVVTLIQRMATRLEAAGLTALDGFGHGTQSAFDEAAWLVLWRLGLPLDDLDSVAERIVTADETAQVEALIAQRISTRQPAAYLTKEAWLQGVPFYVDERVIIPRSFIAKICSQLIEFGPINASIHKIDEHVLVNSLDPLKNIYKGVLERLASA